MTTNNYKAELDLAVAFHEVAVKERDLARAEVERLRARVGWLDHLDTPEGRTMHATEAVRVENEQLRADLREGVQLLIDSWGDVGRSWEARYDAFMAKDIVGGIRRRLTPSWEAAP